MSDTPETDAAVEASGGDWSPVLRAVSQRLERERDEALDAIYNYKLEVEAWELLAQARRERDEARAERDILKLDAQREAEHHDRMVGELERVYAERDRLDNALMKIEDLFVDGTDIYADRENMGLIAREALAQHK
jgi:regulator of protease activity HflC (stomatin/prohibitin superfamily)